MHGGEPKDHGHLRYKSLDLAGLSRIIHLAVSCN
jgi:hypothetical protein